MNSRAMYIVENVKNNNTYQFSIPLGVPYTECLEVCKEILAELELQAKQREESEKKRLEEEAKLKAEAVEGELVS